MLTVVMPVQWNLALRPPLYGHLVVTATIVTARFNVAVGDWINGVPL